MTAAIVSSGARPRGPLAGSLTSISAAPPSRAAAASDVERTLTSSSAMLLPGRLPFCGDYFDGEKTHPTRVGPKRRHLQVGKHKAVQNRPLEPRRVVEMSGAVG